MSGYTGLDSRSLGYTEYGFKLDKLGSGGGYFGSPGEVLIGQRAAGGGGGGIDIDMGKSIPSWIVALGAAAVKNWLTCGSPLPCTGRQQNGGGTQLESAQCDPGFEKDPYGVCVFSGSPGDTSITTAEEARKYGRGGGMIGLVGVEPLQVGTINGHPILRCPSRMVLGVDDVCYYKGILPRKLRKWVPTRRPPVTAADAAAIRRAASAQKRVKTLAGNVGLAMCSTGKVRFGRKKKKK